MSGFNDFYLRKNGEYTFKGTALIDLIAVTSMALLHIGT
jgi:hypothetical protein